ncbi:cell division protein, partial [Pontibacter sp. HJ8]
KITDFQAPFYFVDEMEEGTFTRFRHEHHFSEQQNRTVMLDVFDYTSPWGVLGRLADHLFLEKYMTNLLKTRNEVIKDFAESGKWKTVLS